MESIGEILSETRKKQNYTVEQVARDTHISRRFIQALEAEEYSAFPGEAYLVGFLRNYADYLGLSSDDLVSLYQNMKIQEQPIPIKELLETKPKWSSIRLLLIILVVAAAVVGVGYIAYRYVFPLIADRSAGQSESSTSSSELSQVPAQVGTGGGEVEEYLFQEEIMVRWYRERVSITVPLSDAEYRLSLQLLRNSVRLQYSDETVEMQIGQEHLIDLDTDTLPDVKLVVNDIEYTELTKRFNLGLYKITEVAMLASEDEVAPEERERLVDDTIEPPIRRVFYRPRVVMATNRRTLFNVEIAFRRYCLFRYLLDGQRWEERFFEKNDVISLEARQELMMWMSNAGALRAKIEGTDIDLGRSGEAATRLVRWVEGDQPHVSELKVFPVY